jgi:hypothetical protein
MNELYEHMVQDIDEDKREALPLLRCLLLELFFTTRQRLVIGI